jgi:hypothetical protein
MMHFTKILLVCFGLVLLAGLSANQGSVAAVVANPKLVADGSEPFPPKPVLVADGSEPFPPKPVLVADGSEPFPPKATVGRMVAA